MNWKHFTVTGSSGGFIACSEIHVASDAGTVVLGHGIASQRFNSTNTVLGPMLAEQGLNVVVYDASGHGQSSGAFGSTSQLDIARDIIDVLGDVRTKGSGPVGLLGNSYSGGASVHAAAQVELVCLGLKAPCLDWEGALTAKVGADAMRAWKRDGVAEAFGNQECCFGTVQVMRPVDLFAEFDALEVPIRVWQGSDDEDIPEADRDRLRDLCETTDRQFTEFIGGDHRLTEPHTEAFLADVVEFFGDHLS